MASNTMATWHKRTRAHKNAGRKRKNLMAKHSTPSYDELFAALGEPGKPAPKTAKPAAKATRPAARPAPAKAAK